MGKTRLIHAVLLAASFFPWIPPVADENVSDEARQGERWSERLGSVSLKTLSADEVDFRGCDGGGQPAVDFWSADVWGLYSAAYTPASCHAIIVQVLREGLSCSEWCFW